MKHILIVDDNERITDMFARLLTAHGCNAIVANCVDEANEVMKLMTVDLVLLDIKMPEIQGDVLYELIRMFHKKSKVLISSLYSVEEQQRIESGQTQSFDDFLAEYFAQ